MVQRSLCLLTSRQLAAHLAIQRFGLHRLHGLGVGVVLADDVEVGLGFGQVFDALVDGLPIQRSGAAGV